MGFQAIYCHVGFRLPDDSFSITYEDSMYLRDIAVYADESIAERFPSGFVGWFHTESCCVSDMYRSLLHRQVLTPDTVKVHICFTDHSKYAPSLHQLIDVADATWLFPFPSYATVDVL